MEGTMTEKSGSETVSTKLQRIAELARRSPGMTFTTLAHHIDLEWMHEAYRRTRKDGAVGIDGQTAEAYELDLEGNLQRLLERAKAGTYRAPAVRRVHIPKGSGGETRPIGIPTFEDKVLQRAVAMILVAVYEQDFLDCSYGYRHGRSAQQALRALRSQVNEMGGGWILEVDVRKFFDTLEHVKLQEIVRQRVHDGVIKRLVGKWLNAAVWEDGELSYPEAGTPQGGVISPILANIYLHEVLDVWFEREIKPRLRGKAHLIRYADDAVMLFEHEQDARRVMEVLPKRFGKYGLTLHPEKTRLVPFKRPTTPSGDDDRGGSPGTFDLLGFTHHWARTRRGTAWRLLQRTAKDRFRRAVVKANRWQARHRHDRVKDQHRTLSSMLRGHYVYYGLRGNAKALWRFLFRVVHGWWRWLSHRSQKAKLTWTQMKRLLERYPLPKPRAASLV
jgi:RNA-directed DNA polymerase